MMRITSNIWGMSFLMWVMVSMPGAQAREGDQIFPYSMPGMDMKHWTIAGNPACSVRSIKLNGEPFPTAIEFDARLMYHGETFAVSDAFPVTPMRSYRLGGMVKRIRGGGDRYEIYVQWQDKDHKPLAPANLWNGVFVGNAWEPHTARVISPENARFAQIVLGLGQGPGTEEHIAWFTNFELTELATIGAEMAIDLMPEPVSPTGEPFHLNVRLENRGDQAANDLKIVIQLPKGVQSSESLRLSGGNLSYGQAYTRRIPISGMPADPDETIRCEVTASVAGGRQIFRQTTRLFVTTSTDFETDTQHLKPPVRPRTDLKLGCWYMPSMMDWDHRPIHASGMKYVDTMKPLLGYYDEARPEVADWHIQWAAAHGISFMVFDWFWNKDMDLLSDALDQGFLKSRFADCMEFGILWANHATNTEFQSQDYSDVTLSKFMHALCRRYFTRRNYLRVDGKPVVFIFMPAKIVNERGGWEGCRKGLELMRAIARSYGHPGVYFVASHQNPHVLDYGRGGFDCATAYTFMYCDVPLDAERSAPYEALLPAYREGMALARRKAHDGKIHYIPSAWAGWDDQGRAVQHSTRTRDNTPGAFRRMIETLPDYVEADTKLALIEAWNEWGEGTRIEPGKPYGFGFLNAIRDSLSNERGPYRVPVPSSRNIQDVQTSSTMGTIFESYQERFARRLDLHKGLSMDFKSPDSLWMRPDYAGDMRFLRIEGGALRGQSIGRQPVLLGPPFMGLDAAGIRAIRIRMSTTKGNRGNFFWNTETRKEWSDECSLPFDIVSDGRMHDYLLPVGDNPHWTGSVQQFRLIPADAPGDISIERVETVAAAAR